jgi:DNA repair exonuclease SbcCD ATPase subunit
MKMKILLPWLCLLGALSALGWLYSAGSSKDAELAKLRADNEQLQARLDETKAGQAQTANEELVRLRKDNEDLLRLRNEIRQLRDEKQRLGKEVQTAQARAQDAQAQAQEMRQSAAQAAQALSAQQQQQAQAVVETARQRMGCINSLRQLDAAKQQWALENNKPAGTPASAADLAPYLPGNALPVCPSGGGYTINPVGQPAVCSIPGHVLAK